MKQLLDIISNEDMNTNNNAYFWATGIILCLIMEWLLHHPVDLKIRKIGVDLKTASVAIVYKKVRMISIQTSVTSC